MKLWIELFDLFKAKRKCGLPVSGPIIQEKALGLKKMSPDRD